MRADVPFPLGRRRAGREIWTNKRVELQMFGEDHTCLRSPICSIIVCGPNAIRCLCIAYVEDIFAVVTVRMWGIRIRVPSACSFS